MTTYVYDRDLGIMVDKQTREPMLNHFERSKPIQAPRVMPDIEPYVSPIDGSVIGGRRARRYDLEKNNCIDANELTNGKTKKLKNKRFIEKRGLQDLAE